MCSVVNHPIRPAGLSPAFPPDSLAAAPELQSCGLLWLRRSVAAGVARRAQTRGKRLRSTSPPRLSGAAITKTPDPCTKLCVVFREGFGVRVERTWSWTSARFYGGCERSWAAPFRIEAAGMPLLLSVIARRDRRGGLHGGDTLPWEGVVGTPETGAMKHRAGRTARRDTRRAPAF